MVSVHLCVKTRSAYWALLCERNNNNPYSMITRLLVSPQHLNHKDIKETHTHIQKNATHGGKVTCVDIYLRAHYLS